MGSTLSGVALASLIYPVLHEYLTLNYGLKGYFLLLGGIILQTVLCGAVMRPPPWLKGNLKKATKKEVKKTKSLDTSIYFISGGETFNKQINDKVASVQHTNKELCLISKKTNINDILT